MREVGKNKHQGLWIEALDAKFEGRGEPYDREKFDRILGSYEVRTLGTGSSPRTFKHQPWST